jgi:hypothetical protein
VAYILNFLSRDVKCISWYLLGANVAPWVLANSAHVSCALSKVRQLASVDRLNVKMFVSSTNLTADVELVVSRRRNVDAKNRKRMGDNVDPCEIPVEICLVLLQYLPSVKNVVWSLRKE